MEFPQAVKQSTPLKVLLPLRSKPLEREYRCVAEVFIVDTSAGLGVVWLEPYWPIQSDQRVCQICYAEPVEKDTKSWIDNNPKFGPFCIAYQKPFYIERLTSDSHLWRPFQDWQAWRHARRGKCLRSLAWQRIEADLGSIQPRRIV
ncbi:hypothetical protein G3480_04165 [Thiorhodococcus mannitoliphagus]|uniref:Uncharacterized protein n=1 Tax=Thiorhodococcus mannitoliphagus TaxID=329406 RepID=A0A6P1DUZ0_9GAMM|nr:hypothetical protein [Thiorhodococcus mannitoliphagus]NEX19514.1 hypothetical protein [Thiorhodococcus mannitoliphagus]